MGLIIGSRKYKCKYWVFLDSVLMLFENLNVEVSRRKGVRKDVYIF